MTFFGIDISKLTFDVTVLTDNKSKHKKFTNDPNGFESFKKFIKSFVDRKYFCMEATGIYGVHLSYFLLKQKYKVIVENPIKTKAFIQSQLNRNKTDKADSASIAKYCKNLYLNGDIDQCLHKPKNKKILKLQSLVKRIEQLSLIKTKEINHLESCLDKTVIGFIKKSIADIDKQINKTKVAIRSCVEKSKVLTLQVQLLLSIKGIGEITSWSILAYIGDISLFEKSTQLTSYAGITPANSNSGTTVRSSRLSKMGSRRLRKALYMPALSAKKHNPVFIELYDRLLKKGKPKKVALCAVMRKLLVLSFAILKSETPFDPNFQKRRIVNS